MSDDAAWHSLWFMLTSSQTPPCWRRPKFPKSYFRWHSWACNSCWFWAKPGPVTRLYHKPRRISLQIASLDKPNSVDFETKIASESDPTNHEPQMTSHAMPLGLTRALYQFVNEFYSLSDDAAWHSLWFMLTSSQTPPCWRRPKFPKYYFRWRSLACSSCWFWTKPCPVTLVYHKPRRISLQIARLDKPNSVDFETKTASESDPTNHEPQMTSHATPLRPTRALYQFVNEF